MPDEEERDRKEATHRDYCNTLKRLSRAGVMETGKGYLIISSRKV